jgi:hypothetical protein
MTVPIGGSLLEELLREILRGGSVEEDRFNLREA